MARGTPYPENEWKETSWPGVRLSFLHSDRASGEATVLIDLMPNAAYPAHLHLGTEEVFVVAGSYADEAGEYPAGSLQRFPKGSSHHPRAGEWGALLVTRVSAGIELLELPV